MVLVLKNVSKTINNKEIIKQVCFSLNNNEVLALIGPNGAGKTTLLNLISTLLKPDTGIITLGNKDIFLNKKEALKDIFYLQDSSVLYGDLTGYDHLLFVAKLKSIPRSQIEKVISSLKMSDYVKIKVKKYSLGMKQHLILALAMISKAKLVLLDEPLNGLDPSSSLQLREIILNLKKEGTSIIFSSHILSEVDKVADRFLFIKDGQIVNVIDNNVHDLVTYLITFSNINIPVKLIENNIIKSVIQRNKTDYLVTVNKDNTEKFFEMLFKKNYLIKDIQRIDQGSELIYHEIYEEK